MTHSELISSREIMAALRIRSVKTLTRWHQRGLIPVPTVMTHPTGKGKMAFWPEWVLARCLEIRKRLKAGESLDQIRQQFAGPAPRSREKISLRQTLLHIYREEATIAFFDSTYTALEAFVRSSGRRSDFLHSLYEGLDSPELVKAAEAIIEAGEVPVLIIDGSEINCVAKALIGERLSHDRAVVVLAVPTEARAALDKVMSERRLAENASRKLPNSRSKSGGTRTSRGGRRPRGSRAKLD